MSSYQFYSLSEKICKEFDLSPAPLPVRIGKEKEIFKPTGVALDLLLDELEKYLIEHPDERPLYKNFAVRLAYLEGVRLGQEGAHEMAAHYFELGLALDPENLSLRMNDALALQSSGRADKALAQYRYLLQRPQVGVNPLLWILAARQFLDSGDPITASQLLEACAQFMPVENEFWELLAEARQRAGIAPWMAPGQKPAAQKVQTITQVKAKVKSESQSCGSCGKPVKPGARFCGSCGKAV